MVVLTQKGENESLGKNIFRVTGGNERSLTLIKPQGNDRVTARSLPKFRGLLGQKKGHIHSSAFKYTQKVSKV